MNYRNGICLRETIGGSADKNLPLLTMFLRKVSFFRMFPSIKSQESYKNLRPTKKALLSHGSYSIDVRY